MAFRCIRVGFSVQSLIRLKSQGGGGQKPGVLNPAPPLLSVSGERPQAQLALFSGSTPCPRAVILLLQPPSPREVTDPLPRAQRGVEALRGPEPVMKAAQAAFMEAGRCSCKKVSCDGTRSDWLGPWGGWGTMVEGPVWPGQRPPQSRDLPGWRYPRWQNHNRPGSPRPPGQETVG